MKIISKFKDYYDFLQGIYGVDNKIIYERKEDKNLPLFVPEYSIDDKPDYFILHICDIRYCVHRYQDNFYFGERFTINDRFFEEGREISVGYDRFKRFKETFMESDKKEKHLAISGLNTKYNCPVLLYDNKAYSESKYHKNVRLIDYGINKILRAHDVYIMISDFLSKEVESVNKRTDKEKIVSHGFDLKTSFRH